MPGVQKITPNLWFNTNAEEAVEFYLSVFKNSKKGRVTRYGKEGKDIHGMQEGTVMTIEFELEGQHFVALNGGPFFKFNEAVSFIVHCNTQQEVDYYWNNLTESGDKKSQQCGWLKDKFGVSWQVVPDVLTEMIASGDQEKSQRVFAAMLKMKKIDIAALEKAYHGELENA
jgi:predicted 3-demethylubiquinone-9 3-methyltransferase (glyoxalase superfamily)